MSRPTWDAWALALAEVVATRSPDPHTKHGCVILDANHRIVSAGYNGPISGVPHQAVPIVRPDKYLWYIHAEENAVLFSDRARLLGATAYVTGHPCAACLRRMIQCGIKRVVYGDRVSASETPAERDACAEMASLKNVWVDGPMELGSINDDVLPVR
jgi:dCMP deaminase